MDAEQIVTYAFAAIGAASAVVAALNAAIVPLRDYAASTASKTDDALIEVLARFTQAASEIFLALGKVAAVLAMRNPQKTFAKLPMRPGGEP